MKSLLANIVLGALALFFVFTTIEQCNRKQDERKDKNKAISDYADLNMKYVALQEAKTKSDTIWKEGKTNHVYHDVFKTITDTLMINGTDTLLCYEDSLNRTDLRLKATIWASKLQDIDYEYNVTEKIITNEHIVTKTDTLIVKKYKGQLIGTTEIGINKSAYSVGLQYQSKNRIGISAKKEWYNKESFYMVGLTYRIF